MIELPTGYKRIHYKVVTEQDVDAGQFNFGFGNTGTGSYVYFYGNSGKLYDQEDNYFGSYGHEESIQIEGNIFSGYHNYFYRGELIHDNCTRLDHGSGINAFFFNNLYTGYGLTVYASDSF